MWPNEFTAACISMGEKLFTSASVVYQWLHRHSSSCYMGGLAVATPQKKMTLLTLQPLNTNNPSGWGGLHRPSTTHKKTLRGSKLLKFSHKDLQRVPEYNGYVLSGRHFSCMFLILCSWVSLASLSLAQAVSFSKFCSLFVFASNSFCIFD